MPVVTRATLRPDDAHVLALLAGQICHDGPDFEYDAALGIAERRLLSAYEYIDIESKKHGRFSCVANPLPMSATLRVVKYYIAAPRADTSEPCPARMGVYGNTYRCEKAPGHDGAHERFVGFVGHRGIIAVSM